MFHNHSLIRQRVVEWGSLGEIPPIRPALGPINSGDGARWPMTVHPFRASSVGRPVKSAGPLVRNTRPVTIQPEVESKIQEGATFSSDESSADHPVEASGRPHGTVCPSQQEYARDEDASVKCIATRWRAFGPGCGIFYDLFEGCTKDIWHSTTPCLSRRIISNESITGSCKF